MDAFEVQEWILLVFLSWKNFSEQGWTGSKNNFVGGDDISPIVATERYVKKFRIFS